MFIGMIFSTIKFGNSKPQKETDFFNVSMDVMDQLFTLWL